VAQLGATPVITWEPWDPSAGTAQPAYAPSRIAAGAFDAYVTAWAQQARSYGGPVVVRFAHEMNGSWYPWAAGVDGTTAAAYVAAWRHVVGIFRAQGAGNVTWQWSPNVPYPGSATLGPLYPGDAYVDSVALDGYNWAGVTAGAPWTSFADVVTAGAQQVRALTRLPLYVAETATAEEGGAKAAWIAGMFATLEAGGTFAGFTWFDLDKEGDWRIDSDPEALAAFRDGLVGY
jgi:beta-mannanase